MRWSKTIDTANKPKWRQYNLIAYLFINVLCKHLAKWRSCFFLFNSCLRTGIDFNRSVNGGNEKTQLYGQWQQCIWYNFSFSRFDFRPPHNCINAMRNEMARYDFGQKIKSHLERHTESCAVVCNWKHESLMLTLTHSSCSHISYFFI